MLTQEHTQSIDHISRYNGFPYYYNVEDNKYQNGRTAWLKNDTSYLLYVTKKGDTWHSISFQYYANPTFFWVILDANKISDPFLECKEGLTIKVPILSNITFDT